MVVGKCRQLYLNKNKEKMRSESPEVKPCRQVIFDKGAKNIQWRNESLFNKLCSENWKATCKRMKLDYSLPSWNSFLDRAFDTESLRGLL